jgi:hypothetical protein
MSEIMEQIIANYRFEHNQKQRYYRVMLSRDLFGDWVVTRVWGGINKATGRITHLRCFTFDEGIKLIEKITKIRLARGYELVSAK